MGTLAWLPADRLSAIAYRVAADRIAAWLEALRIGRALPTLPLWLEEDLVVPLNQETLETLRITS